MSNNIAKQQQKRTRAKATKQKNHREEEKYEGEGKEWLPLGEKVRTLASVDESTTMAVEESLIRTGLDIGFDSTSECQNSGRVRNGHGGSKTV